jgi:hypothetical protein
VGVRKFLKSQVKILEARHMRMINELRRERNIPGIKLSELQVRRILEQKKYVYLWEKYSLEVKRNLEKRKAYSLNA